MRKLRNDLTGKRFNKLLVVKVVSNKPIKYECLCDCGNTCVVSMRHLITNHTKSCGCQKIDAAKKQNFKDLSGKRFGRLLVINRGPNYKNGARWWCKCDCGEVRLCQSNALLSGVSTSCGCYRLEQLRNALITHGLSKTKEYRRTSQIKRLELKRQYDTEWSIELTNALLNFQPACVICDMTDQEHLDKYNEHLHIDHVKPLSKGNGLKPGNAVVLCCHHNCSKHAKALDQLPLSVVNTLLEEAAHFKAFWENNYESLS